MSDFDLLREALLKAARVRASATLEEKLNRWAQPPSQTEIEKCERAERMIREAINENSTLASKNIRVFAKGSYANRTNIPSDSDVDVGVLNESVYFTEYPAGVTQGDAGLVDSEYKFENYFQDVARAIVNKFGTSEVTVTDKCIKVRSNSCRVDADVVPHYVHRRYTDKDNWIEGVAIQTKAKTIYNWPEQDYDNGVAKNSRTNRSYKALVRILKSIRSEMEDENISSARHAKSYLIACLVWNVPDEHFNEDTYETILFNALDYLISMTSNYENVKEWGEVNELKYLFRDSQPWKLQDVNQFLRDAKAYAEGLR